MNAGGDRNAAERLVGGKQPGSGEGAGGARGGGAPGLVAVPQWGETCRCTLSRTQRRPGVPGSSTWLKTKKTSLHLRVPHVSSPSQTRRGTASPEPGAGSRGQPHHGQREGPGWLVCASLAVPRA